MYPYSFKNHIGNEYSVNPNRIIRDIKLGKVNLEAVISFKLILSITQTIKKIVRL